jgi:hypothetical protein
VRVTNVNFGLDTSPEGWKNGISESSRLFAINGEVLCDANPFANAL